MKDMKHYALCLCELMRGETLKLRLIDAPAISLAFTFMDYSLVGIMSNLCLMYCRTSVPCEVHANRHD